MSNFRSTHEEIYQNGNFAFIREYLRHYFRGEIPIIVEKIAYNKQDLTRIMSLIKDDLYKDILEKKKRDSSKKEGFYTDPKFFIELIEEWVTMVKREKRDFFIRKLNAMHLKTVGSLLSTKLFRIEDHPETGEILILPRADVTMDKEFSDFLAVVVSKIRQYEEDNGLR